MLHKLISSETLHDVYTNKELVHQSLQGLLNKYVNKVALIVRGGHGSVAGKLLLHK